MIQDYAFNCCCFLIVLLLFALWLCVFMLTCIGFESCFCFNMFMYVAFVAFVF